MGEKSFSEVNKNWKEPWRERSKKCYFNRRAGSIITAATFDFVKKVVLGDKQHSWQEQNSRNGSSFSITRAISSIPRHFILLIDRLLKLRVSATDLKILKWMNNKWFYLSSLNVTPWLLVKISKVLTKSFKTSMLSGWYSKRTCDWYI